MSDQPPKGGELILYRTANDSVRVEVLYESETFWLDQRRMAELFGVDVRTVSEHLRNIYASGELSEEATLRKIRMVRTEGAREVARDIVFYNLDAIISVGYRVNSAQATQFRIWATQTLREFIVKGFVLDDERLKLNKRFGKDYFDELLERIREIRASERRFYLKTTDIYEQCSIDYDKHAETTQIRSAFPTMTSSGSRWTATVGYNRACLWRRSSAGRWSPASRTVRTASSPPPSRVPVMDAPCLSSSAMRLTPRRGTATR